MPPAPSLLMLSPYDSYWLESLSDLFPRICVYLAVRACGWEEAYSALSQLC